MDQETPRIVSELTPAVPPFENQESSTLLPPEPEKPFRGLKWIFVGDQGLRAGWSVAIFFLLFICFVLGINAAFSALHLVSKQGHLAPKEAFFGELAGFLALVLAAGVVALIERRHILDYNLRGPRRLANFAAGLVTGFAALSALVGALRLGGWIQFGPVALSGSQILTYALIWAGVFLLVGCVEEGLMRCYLQFTLTRGLNFWIAAALVAAMCISLLLRSKGNGVWGVYIIALLGLFPCLWLEMTKNPGSGFWQAAWVTSTFFGFGHTGNNGENWIGIFAAAFIGFVFCVSVWVTGSAWWAIGCHAAWDWAETYFYGTADSGLVARGHYLTTSPAGNALWSGGADGPEGSLLIVPIVLLILAWLLIIYRRPKAAAISVQATEPIVN
jgi:membrane protease YdiL (CAAX protease family)